MTDLTRLIISVFTAAALAGAIMLAVPGCEQDAGDHLEDAGDSVGDAVDEGLDDAGDQFD